jgi:phospholipid transport system substrate-binding protein
VQVLISETMDIDGIARFALGRFWNAVGNEERDKFVRFFPVVLLGAIGSSLGTYQRMNFTVDRGARADDCVQVWTTVLRAGDAPRQVGWTIGAIGGSMKIVDIIAEVSSLRITQRNICTSFLAHNNQSIPALIETLRWQADAMS